MTNVKLISNSEIETKEIPSVFLNGLPWFRIVLYFAFFIGTQALQIYQGDFLNTRVWQPINMIIFLSAMFQLLLVDLDFRFLTNEIRQKILIALDAVALVAFIFVFGTFNSMHLFLLLTVIAGAGVIYGFEFGFKIALFGFSLQTIVFTISPQLEPTAMYGTWAINLIAATMVAYLSGVLGHQLKSAKIQLATKNIEIKSLENINEIIVENIATGLIMFGADKKIIKANRGAAILFNDLALEGRELGEFFIELDQEVDAFAVRTNEKETRRVELQYFNRKKERLIIETILSKVKSLGDEGSRYMCLLQNLTEVKSLEFALHQKEKLAAVGQLAAGIAHEIRNPLASISGSVQLLQANLELQTPEDKKLLAIVIKEIDRLNRLITEFLDFVRPEVRVEDPVNLNNLAREVLEIAKVNPTINQKVEQHTELRAENIIFGHYDKLKQALLNFVINSYQAMTDTLRPEIFIRTYDSEDRVVFVVRDNGCGMSKENIQKIFEPFHTTKPNGTGLGLAITHKILEAHEASVHIESEIGMGTQISVSFPVGQSPESERQILAKQA